MSFLFSLFILLLGVSTGSFLNVVIYRLPKGESILYPPSHCPECGKKILWYDNIPLLSFILLGGKCRACKKKISWRYPVVELSCGIFFLLSLWRYLNLIYIKPFFILYLIKELFFISVLIPVFFIDIEHQIIPDCLSYSLIFSSLILSAFQGFLIPSLKGVALGAGIFLLIFYLSLLFLRQPGMGMGDVKIASGIGAFFGWKMALLSFFLSFFLGALVAGIFLLLGRKKMKDKIPFGPFLVTGSFITLFLGKKIVEVYLNLFW